MARRRRVSSVKLAFHDSDTDTDILADILARIVARMSACRLAYHRNNFRKSRVGRVGEDPREDVLVGVGVVECQLYNAHYRTSILRRMLTERTHLLRLTGFFPVASISI